MENEAKISLELTRHYRSQKPLVPKSTGESSRRFCTVEHSVSQDLQGHRKQRWLIPHRQSVDVELPPVMR